MEKKRFTTVRRIDPELLANDLKELVSEDEFMEEQLGNTTVFVIEKYYFRNNSYASCTVCIEQEETGTEVAILCSGAGEGILNISWGATGNFMKKVEEVIQKYI